MKTILSSRAEKQLRSLGKIDQIAVANKIRQIHDQPDLPKGEKLTGFKNVFRIRVSTIRIVYRISTYELHIILIGQRKDIYRLLKALVK